MALRAFGNILMVSSACAVAMLVWIGVRGCGWPSSASIWHTETAVLALIKRAPNSVSAADDMTAQIYLQDIEDGTIVEGYVVLSGHEHVSSHATARC
jgi:hypothetical protein